MTVTLERPDLRSLTPAELAELAAIGAEHNGELAAQVAEEQHRRKRSYAAQIARRRADPVTAEWVDAAHAQMMQAESELAGKLVRQGSPVKDAWSLWSGSPMFADAHCTDDLRRWWELPGNRRVTLTEFKAQERQQREAYADERAMECDEPVRVRSGRGSEPGEAGHRGRRDVVPGSAPRAEAAPRAGAGDRSAGNPGHVRRAGGHVSITDERPAKSATGQAVRARMAARQGTGTFGGQATVAVREDGAVAATRQPDVSGAEVLRAIRICLGHFAVWPSEDALTAATLWVAQSHAKDPARAPVWAYAPRFMLLSREGGSGKSWMARLMAKLAPEGRMLVEMTKAALIQQIAEHRTVVVDETDILFGSGNRNAGIRALVNAGYEPDQSTSRMRGRQLQEVPLFGPMILAGLDKLKDATGDDLKTLISRCIIVHVRRAPDGYRPPRFDNEARAIALVIGQRAARWMAQEVANGIGDVVPDVPEGLGNRPSALWEPLFAVADAAGGDWPVMAREACVRLERAAGVPDEEEEAIRELDDVLAGWDTAGSEGSEWA